MGLAPACHTLEPPGLYRPRNARTTALYQLLEAYYEDVKAIWEERFEKKYGFWRGFVDTVVARYLDCGVAEAGFARLKCESCGSERLLTLSCKHGYRHEPWVQGGRVHEMDYDRLEFYRMEGGIYSDKPNATRKIKTDTQAGRPHALPVHHRAASADDADRPMSKSRMHTLPLCGNCAGTERHSELLRAKPEEGEPCSCCYTLL